MKIFGFFILIYGWFILFDAGVSLEGILCLIGGVVIVCFEEILSRIEWRRYHNDK